MMIVDINTKRHFLFSAIYPATLYGTPEQRLTLTRGAQSITTWKCDFSKLKSSEHNILHT